MCGDVGRRGRVVNTRGARVSVAATAAAAAVLLRRLLFRSSCFSRVRVCSPCVLSCVCVLLCYCGYVRVVVGACVRACVRDMSELRREEGDEERDARLLS